MRGTLPTGKRKVRKTKTIRAVRRILSLVARIGKFGIHQRILSHAREIDFRFDLAGILKQTMPASAQTHRGIAKPTIRCESAHSSAG